MTNKTITQDQINVLKDAAKALKDYNEITGMGLGFAPNHSNESAASFGFFGILADVLKPSIPQGADGPYPLGLRAEVDLNNLIKELES
jgi:hypothetical protein